MEVGQERDVKMLVLSHGQEIFLENDATQPVGVLREVRAPFQNWIDVAMEYYRVGMYEQFEFVLSAAREPQTVRTLGGSQQEGYIAVLDLCAQWCIQKFMRTGDSSLLKESRSLVDAAFQICNSLQITSPRTVIADGFLLLLSGDYRHSQKRLDEELFVTDSFFRVCALLGKACALYHDGKGEGAVHALGSVIQTLSPQIEMDGRFRLALGMCLNLLDRKEQSRVAFERAVEIDPSLSTEAKIYLAQLELSLPNVEAAGKLLEDVIREEPYNPVALTLLADHYFFKKEYNAVKLLALNAYYESTDDIVKSLSCYQMGRLYHSQSDYEKAEKYYMKSVSLWSEHVLARFGLGQVLLHFGRSKQALKQIKFVYERDSKNLDVMRLLGLLYAMRGERDKAMQMLKSVAQRFKHDVEVLCKMGELLEIDDQNQSLSYYLDAENVLKEKGAAIPIFLSNNIGGLLFKLGRFAVSIERFKGILENMESSTEGESGGSLPVSDSVLETNSVAFSVSFNFGRCLEAAAAHALDAVERDQYAGKARDVYLRLIGIHPNYAELFCRMYYLDELCGEESPEKWLHFAKAVQMDNFSVKAMLGYISISKGDLGIAQKCFEDLLQNDNRSSFLRVCLGNVYFKSSWRREHSDKRAKDLDHANDYFLKGLSLMDNNAHAACGVAAVMGEHGFVNEARQVLQWIHECTSDIPEVAYNLATAVLALGQSAQAALLFMKVLKHPEFARDPYVHLAIARAHFESRNFQDAYRAVEMAVETGLGETETQYHRARVLHELGRAILSEEKTGASIVEKAIEEVTSAKKMLDAMSQGKQSVYSDLARKHAEKCPPILKKLEIKLKEEREHEKRKELKEIQRKKQAEEERKMRISKAQSVPKQCQVQEREVLEKQREEQQKIRDMLSSSRPSAGVVGEVKELEAFPDSNIKEQATDVTKKRRKGKRRKKRKRVEDSESEDEAKMNENSSDGEDDEELDVMEENRGDEDTVEPKPKVARLNKIGTEASDVPEEKDVPAEKVVPEENDVPAEKPPVKKKGGRKRTEHPEGKKNQRPVKRRRSAKQKKLIEEEAKKTEEAEIVEKEGKGKKEESKVDVKENNLRTVLQMEEFASFEESLKQEVRQRIESDPGVSSRGLTQDICVVHDIPRQQKGKVRHLIDLLQQHIKE